VHRPILLSNLRDARLFDNWRFLLSLSKFGGFRAIRVNANELFSVDVRHRHLPMAMPSPLVIPESRFATLSAAFHFRTLPQSRQPCDSFFD